MSQYVANDEEEAKEFIPRYRLLYAAVAIAALVMFWRLWFLQIIEGQELRTYSERNRVKETKIPAPRGLILDREGRVLVENLPGFEAVISPQYATKLSETAEAISPILNIPAAKIISEVKTSRKKNGPFRNVRIKENLNLDEVVRLKRLRFDHPGLDINEAIRRYYPLHENGAQYLGYTGEISKKQIEEYNRKFRGTFVFEQADIIGKSGLEEVWETQLRGKDGLSFVEVDARGRLATSETPSFLGLQKQNAIPGHNLVLTIDMDLQTAAQKAMFREDALGHRIGSVVAMKTNGEILAWLSRPSFDPNEFSTGISADIWRKVANDPFKPLRNKVIQDHYPPGSTFKPIVALSALQENIVTPSTIIYAPGQMKFGNRVYHDSLKNGHGYVNIIQAIERSSNIFFYKMGIALGIDRIAKYAKALGLGNRTNIRLPHEETGQIPTTEWKARRMGEEWQPGENLSNAIGQGFVLTTALQMAVAYNAIGLEGKVYRPFIVKKVISEDNEVLTEYQPHLIRDVSDPNADVHIEKRHFKTVKEGMRLVANSDRGTARWWKIPGVEMAGKTGTAQLMSFSADEIYLKCENRPLRHRHHGWFVAYAPAENPEITVAVLAEHGCHGNTGSAPVVRDVIQAYMEKHYPERILQAQKTRGLKPHAEVQLPAVIEEEVVE